MTIRKTSLVAAVMTAGVFAGPVLATQGDSGDFIITPYMPVGSGELGAWEFFKQDIAVTQSPDNGAGELVVGFQVMWNYDEPVSDDSWASDVQVIVTQNDGGEQYTVGGLTNEPLADERWSFQGVISDGPGIYGDTDDDIFLPWLKAPLALGSFNVMFTNDWENDLFPNSYGDAQIRFYKVIPAPGAIALIGVAGLVGRGRRRRAS